MPDPQGGARRFSEKEIGLILQRAAELQQHDPLGTAEGGLSLADIEQIAAEAGIDPRHVQAAVATFEPRAADRWPSLLGAPTSLHRERTVDREVPTLAFDAMVETIRGDIGSLGQVSTLGRALAWHSGNRQRQLQITVVPRQGRTTIRAQEQFGNAAGGLFGGIVGGVGGGGGGAALGIVAGALGSPLAGLALAALAVGGSFLLARTLYTGLVGRRARQLEQLLDQLAAQAAETEGG